jgi:hypothetical protein
MHPRHRLIGPLVALMLLVGCAAQQATAPSDDIDWIGRGTIEP